MLYVLERVTPSTCVCFVWAVHVQTAAGMKDSTSVQAAQDSFNAIEANHAWDQRAPADAQANKCTPAVCVN